MAATYEVFVWYVQGANRATNAPFVVDYAGDSATVPVNQQINGSEWFSIGSYAFSAGTSGRVRLNNVGHGSVVVADAVRFVTSAEVPINADFDGDQDVDVRDLAVFWSCLTGPGAGPPTNACRGADFDGDGDVDQADFGVLQRCLSGYRHVPRMRLHVESDTATPGRCGDGQPVRPAGLEHCQVHARADGPDRNDRRQYPRVL